MNKNLVRLRAIADIDYFQQSVPQGLDIDKAIDIFDRVNSLGTKLTEAELVLTHIAGLGCGESRSNVVPDGQHVGRECRRVLRAHES